MIHGRIIKGTYIDTTDNTLKELSQFQDFLCRSFYSYECYQDMKPNSNSQLVFMKQTKLSKVLNFKRNCCSEPEI